MIDDVIPGRQHAFRIFQVFLILKLQTILQKDDGGLSTRVSYAAHGTAFVESI